MGKFKEIIRIFYMKMFQLLKEFKKSTIFKSEYIKIFEYCIFEVLKFLYFRFSNFIIFRALNLKNVKIHTLKLTWQTISDRSSQFQILREKKITLNFGILKIEYDNNKNFKNLTFLKLIIPNFFKSKFRYS